jgi:hypothetical protein
VNIGEDEEELDISGKNKKSRNIIPPLAYLKHKIGPGSQEMIPTSRQ